LNDHYRLFIYLHESDAVFDKCSHPLNFFVREPSCSFDGRVAYIKLVAISRLRSPSDLSLSLKMEEAEQSITQMGFKISSQKLPILKAGPIEEMTNKLGIAPPEMIFGDNFIRIEHIKSGWAIKFNAFDALDRVDKTGDKMLKVSYSKQWQANRSVLLLFGRSSSSVVK
jgi:hypothetical protein